MADSKVAYSRMILISFLLLHLACVSYSQPENKRSDPTYRFQFSSYIFINGGTALSASFGYWKTTKYLQPATNISTILSIGKQHIGNNSRNGTKFQWNILFSPMLTSTLNFKTPSKIGIPEEIMPLYLNNSSAIYSNYRSSFTMGTTFIATPKGFGRNYTTNRNRSQQVAFFQLKIGTKGDFSSFQANLIEDVGPQFLADKYDRYFTGGGSLQYRWKQYKLKAISEVYTGTTKRDIFDYPDVVYPNERIGLNDKKRGFLHSLRRFTHGGIIREKTYALQDASQVTYNTARMIYGIDIDHSVFSKTCATDLNMIHSLYFFRQGGSNYDPKKSLSMGPMWSQNVIHGIGTNDILKVIRTDSLTKNQDQIPFKIKNKGPNFLEPKHWFEPYYKTVKNSVGYGLSIKLR